MKMPCINFGFNLSSLISFAPLMFTCALLGGEGAIAIRPVSSSMQATLDCGNGVKLDLLKVNAGSFQMGSNDNEVVDKPVHRVTLTKAFYIGIYEVTQEQYQAVTGKNPSETTGVKLPVGGVSWNDAQDFCKALGKKMGKIVRLPTEAEWEYACRAGAQTRFHAGDLEKDLDRVAWYGRNSLKTVHAVGQKTPNAFGLYDMHGNVAEWCQDWYGFYPDEAVTDPKGPPISEMAVGCHVLRGGSWEAASIYCRSSYRNGFEPDHRYNAIGFRVVLDIPVTAR